MEAQIEDGAARSAVGGEGRRWDARHRWKVLAVGFAANAAFSAAIMGLPAAAVLVRQGYALDTTQLGIALSGIGLGITLSEIPWGAVTDRWGDRRVLLSGLFLTAAVLAALGLLVSPDMGGIPAHAALVAGLVLLGLAGGSLNGSSGRAVMGWFTDADRGLAMSIRQTALPVGGAIGALLLPMVIATHGFSAAYGLLAVLCVLSAAFAWRWLHEAPAAPATGGGAPRLTAPLRDSTIWKFVVGMGVLCAPQIATVTFVAVFLHDVGGMGLGATTAAMVIYQCLSAVVRVGSGYWTDRHKNRRAYLRGCAALSAATFLSLAGTTWAAGTWRLDLGAAFLALAVAGGVIASCWHGVAFTELAVLAGPARVGTALGLGNTLVFGSYFLTPLLVSGVLAHGSWGLVWTVVAALPALSLLLLPRAARASGAG